MNVRECREGPDLLFPRVKKLVLDVGFADMVQDELNMRTLFDKSNRIGELWMEDTDVETQSVARKDFNTTDKVGLDTEVYVFGLDEAADAFDKPIFLLIFRQRVPLVDLLRAVPTQRSLESEALPLVARSVTHAVSFKTVIGMCVALNKNDGFDF